MISPKVYFRDVRKVKPQTLKNYMTMLRKLNNDEEPETVNYLEDTTAVFEYIKKLSLSTQRTYIEEKLEELNFQYDEKMKLYQKTDKEDERMCSLEELKLVADYWMELLDEVIFNEKHHRKVWDIYRYAIIAMLYTDIPPVRLDYANFHIIYDREKMELGKNYVYIDEEGVVSFILQEYKTSRKYHEKIYSATTRLSTIIKEWLEVNDTGFLFPNRDLDAPMSGNAFGKTIPKVFEPTGKKITLNIIRHIWISQNVDHQVLDKNAALAESMCHSPATQKQYIRI